MCFLREAGSLQAAELLAAELPDVLPELDWLGGLQCDMSQSLAGQPSQGQSEPPPYHIGDMAHFIQHGRLPRLITLSFLSGCQRRGPLAWSIGKFLIKFGKEVDRNEAAVLRYLSMVNSELAHKIPIPELVEDYDAGDGNYCIVMLLIDAKPLRQQLDDGCYSASEMDLISEQLKAIIDEWRALPVSYFGSVFHQLQQTTRHTSLWDVKQAWEESWLRDEFWCNPARAGPFMLEEDFRKALADSITLRGDRDDRTDEVVEWLSELHKAERQSPVFTHGDLSPDNILMNGTKVVGIVGWSQAGFYPPYWEYVKARLWDSAAPYTSVIRKAMMPHMLELLVLRQARDIIW